MNPFFYSKCKDNNKSYHEIYIQKYQTNKSNQYLQVIKCHNCNSQWKEIWATQEWSLIYFNPSYENEANDEYLHVKSSKFVYLMIQKNPEASSHDHNNDNDNLDKKQ